MAAGRQRVYHKRDRLRQLRAFCHAARLGSITRAAVHLGLSQPAVSLHVRELENELEAVLFDRGGSGVRLTSAGETLYELSRPLVQGMDGLTVDFMERIDGAVSGRLQLAASPAGVSFVLPSYIRRFRDRYPDVRLRVRSCLPGEGVKLLLDDQVEILFGVRDSCPEDTLEYRQLLPCDVVLITPPDHPLAGRDAVSPEEASAWPAIVPTTGTCSRELGETAARRLGVGAGAVIKVGGWEVVKRYVEMGLGVSVVPGVAVHETDRLSVIPLEEHFPTRSFGVFTRRGRFLTPPARRLLRLMIPEFPDPPPRD